MNEHTTDALAAEVLSGLQAFPESAELVLGGYFALRRYADYRATHDPHAWWKTGRTEPTMAPRAAVARTSPAVHATVVDAW
jgi:hypothetical protein